MSAEGNEPALTPSKAQLESGKSKDWARHKLDTRKRREKSEDKKHVPEREKTMSKVQLENGFIRNKKEVSRKEKRKKKRTKPLHSNRCHMPLLLLSQIAMSIWHAFTEAILTNQDPVNTIDY